MELQRRIGPVLAVLLAGAAAHAKEPEAAALYRAMTPLGAVHFVRCWHLERDYYELRRRIAETGVVWRRQELEQRWEDIRDARSQTCLLGW